MFISAKPEFLDAASRTVFSGNPLPQRIENAFTIRNSVVRLVVQTADPWRFDNEYIALDADFGRKGRAQWMLPEAETNPNTRFVLKDSGLPMRASVLFDGALVFRMEWNHRGVFSIDKSETGCWTKELLAAVGV